MVFNRVNGKCQMKGFLMAYRYGDRQQRTLFPQSVDEYISTDAPVRAYDVIVDSLDFDALGIEVNSHKVGCPQYDPIVMLKLLVYGYSYGIRSSRKLEREIHYNLSFIWLAGGLKPDHKTIAEFRRKNKSAIKTAPKNKTVNAMPPSALCATSEQPIPSSKSLSPPTVFTPTSPLSMN